MSRSYTRRDTIKLLTLASTLAATSTAQAGKAVLFGEAICDGHMALPANTVFEARLQDISLMDIPAKTIGKVTLNPAGQMPIPFKIYFNPMDQKDGHSYALSATIKVDDKLIYANDTVHPALGEHHQETYRIKLVPVK